MISKELKNDFREMIFGTFCAGFEDVIYSWEKNHFLRKWAFPEMNGNHFFPENALQPPVLLLNRRLFIMRSGEKKCLYIYDSQNHQCHNGNKNRTDLKFSQWGLRKRKPPNNENCASLGNTDVMDINTFFYHSDDLRIDGFRQHTPASSYVVNHLKRII